MIVFELICAILLAAALTFILPQLLKRASPAAGHTVKDANLAVYKDRISEIEGDLDSGVVPIEQFELDRDELKQRLLEDLPAEPRMDKAGQPPIASRTLAFALALALPVTACLLYLSIGNPKAISAALPVHIDGAGAVSPDNIQQRVAALAKRLAQDPGDSQSWMLLARSYNSLERYQEATEAFEKALAMGNGGPELLTDYAFALSMAESQGTQKTMDKPIELIRLALEMDPDNSKALALGGNLAFEVRDYLQAILYWEKLLTAAPPSSELAHSLQQRISEAKTLLNNETLP